MYVELGNERSHIRILEFSPRDFARKWFADHSFTIRDIKLGQAKFDLWFRCKKNYTKPIPQCSNAQFLLDTDAPQTRFVSISFDLEENGILHNYQINSWLRAWAGNLLDSSGKIVNRVDD